MGSHQCRWSSLLLARLLNLKHSKAVVNSLRNSQIGITKHGRLVIQLEVRKFLEGTVLKVNNLVR